MSKRPRGRPAKLGDHHLFSLRLPAHLHRELRHAAIDEECSLNDLLVRVIQEWADDDPTIRRRRRDAGLPPSSTRIKPA